jgi:hypothetical protein
MPLSVHVAYTARDAQGQTARLWDTAATVASTVAESIVGIDPLHPTGMLSILDRTWTNTGGNEKERRSVKLGAAKMVAPSLLAGRGSARIGWLRMNGDHRSTSDHRQRNERVGEKLGRSCFFLLAVGAGAGVSRLRMYRHREPDSDQRQHYDRARSRPRRLPDRLRVLMTIEDYQRLTDGNMSLCEALAQRGEAAVGQGVGRLDAAKLLGKHLFVIGQPSRPSCIMRYPGHR